MESLSDRFYNWFFKDGKNLGLIRHDYPAFLNYSEFLRELDDILYSLVVLDMHHSSWNCKYFSNEEGQIIYAAIDFDYSEFGREYICINSNIQPILMRVFNEYQYRKSGAKEEVEKLEALIPVAIESAKKSSRL